MVGVGPFDLRGGDLAPDGLKVGYEVPIVTSMEGSIVLVLSRKIGQQIVIDGHILVTVLDCRGGSVRLGIDAPDEVPIHREEVYHRIRSESLATENRPCGLQTSGA